MNHEHGVTPVLHVDGLTKQFPKDDNAVVALRDFSLEIGEGGSSAR